MRETQIKASKTGLGVFMTAIPGAYAFRETVVMLPEWTESLCRCVLKVIVKI